MQAVAWREGRDKLQMSHWGLQMAEPRNRYSPVSLILHWGIAALILTQVLLITAYEATEHTNELLSKEFIGFHRSVGLTILVLTLARIGWRVANPAIPIPETTPRWQKIVARTTHVLFYVLLIALPLGGWAASSAAQRPIEWFGLFTWPWLPVPHDFPLAGKLLDLHRLGVKALYVLLALHVFAALKHHFIDRDNVLHRMLPFIPRRP